MRWANTAKRPGPIDPDVLAQVEKLTGKKAVTDRPADLLEPGMEKYRQQCAEKGLPADDETVVLFAMFPQQVEALFKPRRRLPSSPPLPEPRPPVAAPASVLPFPRACPTAAAEALFVTVEGRRHEVTVETLED